MVHARLVDRAAEPFVQRARTFLERDPRKRALDEQREAPDVFERLGGHLDAHQVDRGARKAGLNAQLAVFLGREELPRDRVGLVLDLEPALPQHLHRAYHPAAPESRRAIDVRAVEEGRIEREHAVPFQHLADLREHLRFVGNEVDGVQEHDGVGRRDETRRPLGAAFDELDDLGVDGGSGLGQR